MSINISGSNLTTGLNNTVLAAPYGSLSFNGINQSVVTSGTGSGANNTALDITTGSPNYTIECWIYASQHSRVSVPQFFMNQGNGQTVQFKVVSGENSYLTFNTNYLQLSFYSTTLGYIDMSSWPTTMSLNTWYHVALCKDTTDGNRYYLYLNGVLVSSTPNITSLAANQGQPFEFGMGATYISGDPAYAFNGLLSNVRIVKGVALYVPPNVSEPSLPLTATQSLNLSGYNQAITGTQTSLLLTTPNNASYLTDTSSYAQTVTGVNTPTSSALGPGTYSGSILFNGTNQYLTIAAATQFNYSTNDFTWEMWVYPTAANWTTGTFYLMDHGPSNNQGSLHYNNNNLVYYTFFNDQNYPPNSSGVLFPTLYSMPGGSIPANTWTHVAVCRQNLVTNMFINGKIIKSGPDPYNFATPCNPPYYPIVSPATQSVTIGARTDSSYPFKGNISNVRIVNGVSVYNVGNFTPPVRPLPPVQAPNEIGSPSKAIFGAQTSLLMNTSYSNGFLTDSSFNNVTLTQQTVGLYPPSTYTLANNSTNPFNSNGSIFTPGSIYFNGTSQYLTVPSSAVFGFGTGDFTVEGWFYATSDQGTDFMIDFRGSSSPTAPAMFVYTDNHLTWYYNGAVVYQPTSLTFTYNTWNHVAIVRSSGVTRFYLNGIGATTTYTDTNDYPAAPCIIGSDVLAGGPNYWNGYISNVRVVKGTAVYTQNFTPTSGPFTTSQTFNQSGIPSCPVQSSQTELLLTTPANSSFLTDSSTNAFTVTNVGTATSSVFNPFSGNYTIHSNPGSVQFNGTTQYLTVPSNTALAFDTGDYTVEFWAYFTVTPSATQCLYTTLTNNFFFQYNPGSGFETGIGGVSVTCTFAFTVAINTWYHIAVSRSSSTTRCWINGTQIGTPQTDSTSYGQTGAQIGTFGGGQLFQGYLSNLRVVKGVAVYTGGTFSPPTTPLPAVTNTELLVDVASSGAYLTDGSINNFTLTPTGSVSYNASTPVSSGGSLYFDQSTISYLTLPSSNVFDLTGDFTIEAWVNMTTLLAGENGIVDARVNGGTPAPWVFYINGLGQLTFFTGGTYSGATTISTGVWTHVVAQRSGSTLALYVNGVIDYTANIGSGAISPGTTSAFIGTKDYGINAQYRTIDYITNLRFVNGTAIYSGNFVPPAGPLSNSQVANVSGAPSTAVTNSQTSLLLNTSFGTNFLVDGSINNFTVTNVGTATSTTLDPFVF